MSGLAIVCASATVRAERVIEVDVPADSPVTADELAAALRVRIAERGAPVAVRIVTTLVGVVAKVNTRSREVALDGRTGADAARLIALAVADLALADLAVEPRTDPESGFAPVASNATSPNANALHVAVLADAEQWAGTLAGARVDASYTRPSWLVAGEVGLDTVAEAGDLQFTKTTARLEAGLRQGYLDLRLGPTFAMASVSTGAGDRAWLVGAGANARVRVPIAHNVSAVAAAGVDVFADRTKYTLPDTLQLSTPWLAPWAAAGAEVSW